MTPERKRTLLTVVLFATAGSSCWVCPSCSTSGRGFSLGASVGAPGVRAHDHRDLLRPGRVPDPDGARPDRHVMLIDFTILSSLLHGAVMAYDSFAAAARDDAPGRRRAGAVRAGGRAAVAPPRRLRGGRVVEPPAARDRQRRLNAVQSAPSRVTLERFVEGFRERRLAATLDRAATRARSFGSGDRRRAPGSRRARAGRAFGDDREQEVDRVVALQHGDREQRAPAERRVEGALPPGRENRQRALDRAPPSARAAASATSPRASSRKRATKASDAAGAIREQREQALGQHCASSSPIQLQPQQRNGAGILL